MSNTNNISIVNKTDQFFEKLKEELNAISINVSNVDFLGLYIAKYTDKTDFSDPRKKYCRGLVMEAGTGYPVMVPPEKSMNFTYFLQLISEEEKKNDSEIWSNVLVEEFVDGTMVNLFHYQGTWHISTRSKIGAKCRFFGNKYFNEMFDEAKGVLDYSLLNPELTYSFVLRHPENRIVTKYETASLVLVQVRRQYEELDLLPIAEELKEKGLKLTIPKRYSHRNLESVIKQLTDMPFQEQGLVFKYADIRSKLRNEKYTYVKQLRGNNWNEFHTYIEARKNKQISQLLIYYPEYGEQFKKWNEEIKKMTSLLYNCYTNKFIYRTIDWLSIPFELRNHCSEIHNFYKLEKDKETEFINKNGRSVEKKFKINFEYVKNYFNNLPTKRIIWIINFKTNYVNEEGYHESKKTLAEPVEPVEQVELVEQVEQVRLSEMKVCTE